MLRSGGQFVGRIARQRSFRAVAPALNVTTDMIKNYTAEQLTEVYENHVRALDEFHGYEPVQRERANISFDSVEEDLQKKYQGIVNQGKGLLATPEVSSNIAEIDFDYYKAEIEDKEFVAQLQNEFNNKTYSDIEPRTEALTSDYDRQIASADKWGKWADSDLKLWSAALARAQDDHASYIPNNLEAFYERYPNIDDELRKEYFNAEYFSEGATEKIAQADLAECENSLETGSEYQGPDAPETFAGINLSEDMAQEAAVQRSFNNGEDPPAANQKLAFY